MKPRIGVIGKDGDIPEKLREIAEGIGKEIADKGAILVCGGKGGVMDAACEGAKEVGGITVGILPSLDPKDANPHVDVPITTGMNFARNAIIAATCDAIIAINGSVGTLSEITLALNYWKPVILVKGSGGVAEFKKEIMKLKEKDSIKEKFNIHEAAAEEAVEVALKLLSH